MSTSPSFSPTPPEGHLDGNTDFSTNKSSLASMSSPGEGEAVRQLEYPAPARLQKLAFRPFGESASRLAKFAAESYTPTHPSTRTTRKVPPITKFRSSSRKMRYTPYSRSARKVADWAKQTEETLKSSKDAMDCITSSSFSQYARSSREGERKPLLSLESAGSKRSSKHLGFHAKEPKKQKSLGGSRSETPSSLKDQVRISASKQLIMSSREAFPAFLYEGASSDSDIDEPVVSSLLPTLSDGEKALEASSDKAPVVLPLIKPDPIGFGDRASSPEKDAFAMPASPLVSRRQRCHSLSSPSTSPPRTPVSQVKVMPPTPRRRTPHRKPVGPLFPNEIRSTLVGRDLPIQTSLGVYTPTSAYQLSGVSHPLIKQASSKDCGSAAALMLLSSLGIISDQQIKLPERFVSWLGGPLYNRGEMDAGVSLVLTSSTPYKVNSAKLSMDNPLDDVQNELRATGLPVIVSITHPTLSGHWIVVDAVNSTTTTIRDPNTGKAYQIPNSLMTAYLTSDGVEESILSIHSR